ncbi:MAG: hypothetical protein OEU32_14705 [Acidimicrobiia bacterium]|nr:hypothetical protein [Acidimicrobiia bacterium]
MATIGVLLTIVAGPGWFVNDTLYDTDTVVERVDTILGDERVQIAIGDKVTDEIFLLADLDREEARTALDDAADTLGVDGESIDGEAAADVAGEADGTAADVAGEADGTADGETSPETTGLSIDVVLVEALEEQTTELAVAVLASGQLNSALLASVRASHEEFLTVVDGDEDAAVAFDDGLVTIDLEPVVVATLDELSASPLLSFLDTVEVPPDSAVFVVAHDGQGGSVWWTMAREFPDYAGLAMFLAIVLILGAVAISTDRDRIMLGAGVGVAVVALLIAGLTWGLGALVPTVFIRDEITRGAFNATYDSLANPLVGLQLRIAILGAVVAAVGGLLGFILDLRAERQWKRQPATAPAAPVPEAPIYVSPFEEAGLELPPQFRDD